MKKVKEMVNCELKEAKKAVKEAREAYFKSIREWDEAMSSIVFTDYIPKEIPENVINEVLKKLPKDVSGEKIAYEVACHYWRVRCVADSGCVAAEKAVKDAREVLWAKEEVLNRLQTV